MISSLGILLTIHPSILHSQRWLPPCPGGRLVSWPPSQLRLVWWLQTPERTLSVGLEGSGCVLVSMWGVILLYWVMSVLLLVLVESFCRSESSCRSWSCQCALSFGPTGKTLGRTKLTEISPKKTVEGAIGGLASSVVVAMAVSRLTLWPATPLAAAGLGVGHIPTVKDFVIIVT